MKTRPNQCVALVYSGDDPSVAETKMKAVAAQGAIQ